MLKPPHLEQAALTAHSLALELYRFTARWPESEREVLTLEVRRTGHALSTCLDDASRRLQGRALRRALDHARGKLGRLTCLIRFATDVGYRKLSSSRAVDEAMGRLAADLDIVAWELSGGTAAAGRFSRFRRGQGAAATDRVAPEPPTVASGGRGRASRTLRRS
jgi:hypothetical protein